MKKKHLITKIIRKKKKYQQFGYGTKDNGIKFSTVRVRDESSDDRREIGESRPSVD